MKPIDLQDYFELLELTPAASGAEVEHAYERARAFFGPDSAATCALVDMEEARRAVERLEDAYLTLSDPELRRVYEEGLRRSLAPASVRAGESVEAADASIPKISAALVEELSAPPGIAPFHHGRPARFSPRPSELSARRALEDGVADAAARRGDTRIDGPQSPKTPDPDSRDTCEACAQPAGLAAASQPALSPAQPSLKQEDRAAGAAPGRLAGLEPTRAAFTPTDARAGGDDGSIGGADLVVPDPVPVLPLPCGPVRRQAIPAPANASAPETLTQQPVTGPATTEVVASVGRDRPILQTEVPVGVQLVFTGILAAANVYSWPGCGEESGSQVRQALAPDALPATELVRPPLPRSLPSEVGQLSVSSPAPAEAATAGKDLTRAEEAPAHPPARKPAAGAPSLPIPLVAIAPAAVGGTTGPVMASMPPSRSVVRKEERASDEPRAPPQTPNARYASRAPDAFTNAVFNGELLRRVREGKGVTLRELSEKTRIGVGHLENVEADHYDALPVAVYLRGFLMSIARELKLDPLKVAKGYLELVSRSRAPKG